VAVGGGRTVSETNFTFRDLVDSQQANLDNDPEWWQRPREERIREARRRAVEDVLEGYESVEDARESWADEFPGNIRFTASGQEFNKRTATEAIRVAVSEFPDELWNR